MILLSRYGIKILIKMKSKVFMYFVMLLLSSRSYAQMANGGKKPDTILLDEQKDLKSQLLPLDSILAIAVKHSPSVKFQEDLIGSAKAQLEFTKKLWTNNIVGFVNYSGGNQSIVSADNQTPGSLSSSNITSGLRAGIQINLPLSELVGRKSRLNIYKYELNSTIDKKAETEQAIRQNVIQFYYNLLYASEVLAIRNEARQSTINQNLIAQQEFKDGIILISELSRLKSIEINARTDYEDAKRQFSSLYSQIETLIGVPVQQLIAKR
jgi:outer membrane protein TolC